MSARSPLTIEEYPMTRPDRVRRGTALLSQVLMLGPLPLGFLALLQDWYVDASAPGCPSGGSGTQADPYCRVQDAVNAAADGDVIHIAPGTYFENVVLDKDLSLVGTGGDQVTILDGMASGSVVRIEAADVTLTGLTLTNGSGTNVYDAYGLLGTRGGGLYASSADVSLTGCTVTANSVDTTVEARGGGLSLLSGSVTLTDTTVSSNTATSTLYGTYGAALGGGIFVATSSGFLLTNSTVTGNTCSCVGNYAGAIGGGIFTFDFYSSRSSIRASDVSSNACQSMGIYSESQGGGIFSYGSLTIEGTTVSQNTCTSDYQSSGGGVAGLDVVLTSSTVTGNVVAGDLARGGGFWGRPGVGSSCPGSSLITIQNSSVSENSALGSAQGAGGGIHNRGSATITNSTLSNNWASSTGTGIFISSSGYSDDLRMSNSIVWGNGGNPVTVVSSSPHCGGMPTSTVEYSLVEGGWPGPGNIDADPLFVDAPNGNYRLASDSPCIDAGDNSAVLPGIVHDLRGAPRFWDDPFTPDTGVGAAPVVDMGAFEFFRKVRRR